MQGDYKKYGCCADIPEFLLHTGDRWDYPQWYLKYLRGQGNGRMPPKVMEYLDYLGSGGWKINTSLIGIGSLEACVDCGIVERTSLKRPFGTFFAEQDGGPITDIEDRRHLDEFFANPGNAFIGVYRITKLGMLVLANRFLPIE